MSGKIIPLTNVSPPLSAALVVRHHTTVTDGVSIYPNKVCSRHTLEHVPRSRIVQCVCDSAGNWQSAVVRKEARNPDDRHSHAYICYADSLLLHLHQTSIYLFFPRFEKLFGNSRLIHFGVAVAQCLDKEFVNILHCHHGRKKI